MYKAKQRAQMAFDDFGQPIGMQLDPNNRWVSVPRKGAQLMRDL